MIIFSELWALLRSVIAFAYCCVAATKTHDLSNSPYDLKYGLHIMELSQCKPPELAFVEDFQVPKSKLSLSE